MSRTTTTTSTVPARAVQGSVAAKAPSTVSSESLTGPLRLRIDGNWYQLTNWAALHPGGKDILYHLNGQDATDAFYSLHSAEAIERLKRLPHTPCTQVELDATPPLLRAFREFRAELMAAGWWDRSLFWEAFYASSIYLFASLGTYLALSGAPFLAILLIGIAMQQAGWIGHDYVHGRGKYCNFMGQITVR
jgi:hypothetical protein